MNPAGLGLGSGLRILRGTISVIIDVYMCSYWAEASKGEKSGRKDKKKEENAVGKADKDKRKAEAKKLAALEEAEVL